jgi:periplasmic copper chaperone A
MLMHHAARAVLMMLLALGPAAADDAPAETGLHVTGAYASVSRPNAPTGAVYMTIENPTATEDRLLSVNASIAEKSMLHTNSLAEDGMMQMLEMSDGLPIPAEGRTALARGADHVMLMGLTRPLADGDRFTLDLTFETAGKVVVIVTVGNAAPDQPLQ